MISRTSLSSLPVITQEGDSRQSGLLQPPGRTKALGAATPLVFGQGETCALSRRRMSWPRGSQREVGAVSDSTAQGPTPVSCRLPTTIRPGAERCQAPARTEELCKELRDPEELPDGAEGLLLRADGRVLAGWPSGHITQRARTGSPQLPPRPELSELSPSWGTVLQPLLGLVSKPRLRLPFPHGFTFLELNSAAFLNAAVKASLKILTWF